MWIRDSYNDLEDIDAELQSNPHVVAVLVEPVQGEGGVRIPDADYLPGLRELCGKYGALLILDEVQTGLGRTGSLFAYHRAGIVPDVVTLAKSLGNGYPIGACLIGPAAADLMEPGRHGTTFGGSPLACRVALTVLDVLEREQLTARAAQAGAMLLEQLKAALEHLPGVFEIRGAGLMVGIELENPAPELSTRALENRLLINVTSNDRVVRLLPALIIDDHQITTLVEQLTPLIQEVAS